MHHRCGSLSLAYRKTHANCGERDEIHHWRLTIRTVLSMIELTIWFELIASRSQVDCELIVSGICVSGKSAKCKGVEMNIF